MKQSVESIITDYQMKLKNKQRALKREFQLMKKHHWKLKLQLKDLKLNQIILLWQVIDLLILL